MKSLRPNLYDYLKVLALITMIIDHIGFFFFPEVEILRVIWRTAFPLFLFLVGWNHSYKRRNQLRIRWVIFQLFIWWWVRQGISDVYALNILLVIGVVRVVLWILQKIKQPIVEGVLFVCSGLLFFQTVEFLDYGSMSLMFGLLWYWTRIYGKHLSIHLCIGWTVFLHLRYMMAERWFEWSNCFVLVWLLLIWGLVMMSRWNKLMVSRFTLLDRVMLFCSRYSFQIYIFQACLFTGIYLL